MGIYDQPNSWQCGPFALKHALLAHGVFAHEAELTQAAGSTEAEGTDERQLMRAAQAYGAVLGLRRYRTPWGVRRALKQLLAAQTPVLICVDQWDHWVTAVSADDTHVVVMDSHYASVIRIEPWGAFTRRIAYRARRAPWWRRVPVYDLHPLAVRGETGLRMALPPWRARQVLAAPEGVRAELDAFARRLAPFAARNGRRSGAVALAPWLTDRIPNPPAGPEADALTGLALAADVFGIRCDADRLGEVARVVREAARVEPAPVAPAMRPAPAPQRQRALAVAS